MDASSPRPISVIGRLYLFLLGLIISAAGLFFVTLGGKLALLGGSWYFVLAGAVLVISGIVTAMARPLGGMLFLLVWLATFPWSFFDAGFEFWPLISRNFALSVGAVVVLLSIPLMNKARQRTRSTARYSAAAAIVAAFCAVGVWGMFQPHGVISNETAPTVAAETPRTADWTNYAGGDNHDRFSPADQINRDTVKNLTVAWTAKTGDLPESTGGGAEDQTTPLMVNNAVYVCTPHNNVISLDPATGEKKWEFKSGVTNDDWQRCRGLAYFDASKTVAEPTAEGSTPIIEAAVPANGLCTRRVLMNSTKGQLVAIDADTGLACADFGTNGVVDLNVGMGPGAATGDYYPTSAPTLAGTTIVVGGRVGDNVSIDMPGGVVRGFDVMTGALRWAFDPGDPGMKQLPEGQIWTRSTPNVWAPMSWDALSNTVFMPVGSAAIDLWGVKRRPLDRQYGATMLAVDATTGLEKWRYQTVHDDLWDFDVPMQPTFIEFDGRPAMVFGTKAGQIFVLDRLTGKPLTKVEERPVPAGDMPNETYSPTQPMSVGMPQIGADTLTESDMWGATPFDQLVCRVKFKSMRYTGLFTPPGTDASLNLPGSLGGLNWGGVSYDPTNNYAFFNDMRLGLEVQLVPYDGDAKASNGDESAQVTASSVQPLVGTPYAITAKNRFMSPLGIPCQKPPFGTLTAVDMKTQKIAWQIPMGTVQDTGPLGIKMHAPIPIGMPTIGGSMATKGGLVFFAATQDFYLRAIDSVTGAEVWKARLPVGSQGTPISYVAQDGKQYVVISTGGGRNSPERGDYVIAYALPQ
ncbi:membrane-bound PQQ-dependent dehydrogenase, glucose/quinate/shikimate family [Agrobacterium sp.]|uniref:membrane-bound PQQ-dependent dehydrogenase, glucose/quinate/shikimate family n=1 Tax=Agrobacterium sp. TaxID=361 RepID=UPI0028AC2A59|nr:membrane-bound PQQ-dependent dehydrogenase, glucose/quinate/shikimate family [Agrobacterium sp.]